MTGTLTVDALEWGFSEINECIEDFVCDIPKAAEIVTSCVSHPSLLHRIFVRTRRCKHTLTFAAVRELRVNRMQNSCGIEPVSTTKPSPGQMVEEKPKDSAPPPPPLVSAVSVATSAGDYEPALDDGVEAFDDEDL